MPGYNDLLVDIPSYLMNTAAEFASALPGIITNGQFRLSRDLNVVGFNTVASGTMTIGSYSIPRPADLLRPIYLSIQNGANEELLQVKTQGYVIQMFPDTTSAGYGVPIYYAPDNNSSYRVGPTPDAAYAYTLNYMQRLPFLSVSSPTNWITDNAYDALLYACCADGSRFNLAMGDQQQNQIQMYEQRYQEAMQQINAIDEQSERDDTRVPTFSADNR